MKFGLFYELSVPRPWTRESERTVYLNALEQVRLADELGFRPGVGRRAPLPRGVLALPSPRAVPHRLRDDHLVADGHRANEIIDRKRAMA